MPLSKRKGTKKSKPVDYSNLAALWDQFLSMYQESIANPARAEWDRTREIWYGPRSPYLTPRGAFGQQPGAFDYSQYDRYGNPIEPNPGNAIAPGGGVYGNNIRFSGNPEYNAMINDEWRAMLAGGEFTPQQIAAARARYNAANPAPYSATSYMAPLQPGAYPPPITAEQSLANWYKSRNDMNPGVPGVGEGGGVNPAGAPKGYDISWSKTKEGFLNERAWTTFSDLNKDLWDKSNGQYAGTMNKYGQPIGTAAPFGQSGARRAANANAKRRKWQRKQKAAKAAQQAAPSQTNGYNYTPPNDLINWRI